MRGNYNRPSELLRLQKETGKSYWDLIGRPLYDEGKDSESIIEDDPQKKADLMAAIDYALSLSLDKPEYNEGKDKVTYVAQDSSLSYGSYYDFPTGDIMLDAQKLPKFEGGKDPNNKTAKTRQFDDAEAARYIGWVENADSVGFDKKRRIWTPPKSAAYDRNSIGMGLDMRKENNPYVYNYLRDNGRLKNPYLTEKEERMLREKTWKQKKDTYMTPFIQKYGPYLNQTGYNRVARMLYQGDPYKKLNQENSVTGKAFQKDIKSGDKSLQGTFNAYYGYGSNAVKYKDTFVRDKSFK